MLRKEEDNLHEEFRENVWSLHISGSEMKGHVIYYLSK